MRIYLYSNTQENYPVLLKLRPTSAVDFTYPYKGGPKRTPAEDTCNSVIMRYSRRPHYALYPSVSPLLTAIVAIDVSAMCFKYYHLFLSKMVSVIFAVLDLE